MDTDSSKWLDWPLTLWLLAAFASFLLSVAIWFFVDQMTGLFVATWVPSILAFGTLVRRRTK
ncbi:MAG: hypothetical protein CL743_06110 [Chloroflexi bacterium]|jgi:hypothetical protein|nr:hypothetical protein [Chloroflexota bacterium]MCH2532542.1 hypothetical protein [Dehalococcoidia bacterium]HCH35140.1 hypothetical protein [Dehalococcoidia bacterium]